MITFKDVKKISQEIVNENRALDIEVQAVAQNFTELLKRLWNLADYRKSQKEIMMDWTTAHQLAGEICDMIGTTTPRQQENIAIKLQERAGYVFDDKNQRWI